MTKNIDAINAPVLLRDLTAKIEKFFSTDDGSIHKTEAAETVLARLKSRYSTLDTEIVAVSDFSASIEECLDWSIPRVYPPKQSA